jgi:hypothetical protein
MSQQALNKISPNSPSRQNPSEVETQLATALYELETNIPDMRGALRPLQFVSAREVSSCTTLARFIWSEWFANRTITDRSWPRPEGHRRFRPSPTPRWLASVSAAVCNDGADSHVHYTNESPTVSPVSSRRSSPTATSSLSLLVASYHAPSAPHARAHPRSKSAHVRAHSRLFTMLSWPTLSTRSRSSVSACARARMVARY